MHLQLLEGAEKFGVSLLHVQIMVILGVFTRWVQFAAAAPHVVRVVSGHDPHGDGGTRLLLVVQEVSVR